MQVSAPPALTTPAGGEEARPGAKTAVWAVIGAAALLSLLLGLYQLNRSNGAHAILEYDDGVWFGSALRLAHGLLPYKDFVVDQPPGLVLLMSPIAMLSHLVSTNDAFAAARYVTVGVEAVNVALAGRLVRHRSLLCVAVTATVVAVYPNAMITSRTVMLEPYCDLFCLLGLLAVFRAGRLSRAPQDLLASGVLFGVAGSFKAFALFPFAVLLGQILLRPESHERRGTSALWCAAGAAGAFGFIVSPFVVLAPSGFFRQVVIAQVTRATPAMSSAWERLAQLLGVPPAPSRSYPVLTQADELILAIVATFVAAALVLVWWRAAPSPPGRSLDRYAVVCTLVTAAGLAWPPAFYYHYAAFLAPFGAICLGSAAELAVAALSAKRHAVFVVAGTLTALALVAVGTARDVQVVRTVDPPYNPPLAVIDRLISPGACVTTDNPGLLVLADRFSSSRVCPAVVDAFGSTVVWGHGAPAKELADLPRSEAVQEWLSALRQSRYVVVTNGLGPGRLPWGPTLLSYLYGNFREAMDEDGVMVWARQH